MRNRAIRRLCTLVLALPLTLAADVPSDYRSHDRTNAPVDAPLASAAREDSFDIWAPANRKALGAGVLMLVAAASGLAITVSGLKRDLRNRRMKYMYRGRGRPQ
jgi:hypothetical protein